MSRPLIFVSLGTVVIDEIHFGTKSIVRDVLGGSGTYGTLGARLFTRGAAGTVGWMIHAGADWPPEIEAKLLEWRVRLYLRKLPKGVSTRGRLEYQDSTFGPKTFRYTTPVLKVSPDDLSGSGLLGAAYMHLFASPQDLVVQVQRLDQMMDETRPFLIWEPHPLHCISPNLQPTLDASHLVDVVSPNHLELAALFHCSMHEFDKTRIEEMAAEFVQAGIGTTGEGAIIVRAGEHGCLVSSRSFAPVWLAPYYDYKSKSKIVDITGAGNAFLGGFAIGHNETGDLLAAARYGVVAASYALEQIGLPVLTVSDGQELWNGTDPRLRLRDFESRHCES